MMQQQPIDFKSMFQNDPSHIEKNNNISGYIFSIGWYFITMFILATLVFLFFSTIDTFVETITPEDRISNALNEQEDVIFLLNDSGNFSNDAYEMISYQDNSSYTIFILKETMFDDIFDSDGIIDYNKLILSPESMKTIVTYAVDDLTIETLEENFDVFIMPLESLEVLTSYANSVINFIIYVILFIPLIWFLRSDLTFDFKQFITLNKKVIGFVIAGYLYVIFGNIISNVLINLIAFIFSSSYSSTTNQLFIESMLRNDGTLFIILSAVILGPIVEELIFRKAIFGLIHQPRIALFVSSFIFALIHIVTEVLNASLISIILTMIPYLTMGFIFGFIYLKYHKNIYIVTLVHMLTNLISILGLLFL